MVKVAANSIIRYIWFWNNCSDSTVWNKGNIKRHLVADKKYSAIYLVADKPAVPRTMGIIRQNRKYRQYEEKGERECEERHG